MRTALQALAVGVAAVIGAEFSVSAQTVDPTEIVLSQGEADWTVVTLANDGAWGAATEPSAGQAIAKAIRHCKATSRTGLGCGAQFRAIRAGWIVAYRCGAENIVAAERLLADAEQAARRREIELRVSYARDLPPCRPSLTVGPRGEVVASGPQHVGGALTD
jgi:hypothetical protein